MGIDELTLHLGGELVGNTARVRRDGQWVVLGSIANNQWQISDIGQKLLDAVSAPPPPVEPIEVAPVAPTRRGRPRKTVEVATNGDN
jgi:hypothetical protein